MAKTKTGRPRPWLPALLLASFGQGVQALGLGEIRVLSALNEPLLAEVGLSATDRDELERLRVRLAPTAMFQEAGIQYPAFYNQLRFEIMERAGRHLVQIRSRDAVREPFLGLLLEANWGSGRMVREYTLLIDPPATVEADAPVAEPPRRVPTPAPAPAPAPATPAIAPAPAPAPAEPPPADAERDYGQVRASQTLWGIAAEVRPDQVVTMNQVMLGLLDRNPEAFDGGNINNLRAGVRLTVPSREAMLARTAEAARAEVRQQYREWREARELRIAGGGEASAPADELAPGLAPALPPAEADPETEAELRLTAIEPEPELGPVSTAEGEGEGVASDGASRARLPDGELARLEDQLAASLEAVQAQRDENAALSARVEGLEAQLAEMRRELEMRNAEMARLQVQGADTELEPVDLWGRIKAFAMTPVAQFGALLVVLLAALLAAVSGRRGRHAEAAQAPPATGPGVAAATASGEPAGGPPLVRGASIERAVEVASAVRAAGGRQTGMVAGTGELESDPRGQEDPLTEADLYIAYGRFRQARELLQRHLDEGVQRPMIWAKLAEVHHGEGDETAFLSAAERTRTLVENERDPAWQLVLGIGQESHPQHPLFSGAAATPPTTAVDASLAAMAAASTAAINTDHQTDKQADDAATAADLARPSIPDPQAPQAADLEWPAALADGEAAGVDAVPAPRSPTEHDQDRVLDFEPGLAGRVLEPGDLDEEALRQAALAGDDDQATLDQDDEMNTRLELARAYIDMQDEEGARAVLDEVVDQGNPTQREEAQRLLDGL